MMETKEKKMTKKEYFGVLIEIVEGADVDNADELVKFLQDQIALVSKKRSTQTKTQKDNEVLVEVIYEAIESAGHPVTVTEIYEMVKREEIKSSQKVCALVKKLKDAGRVVRVDDKKKAYFSIAE